MAVQVHRGLFERNSAVPNRSWFAWRGLERNGFRRAGPAGVVTLFVRSRDPVAKRQERPPWPEPNRREPVFCQGWYGEVSPTSGRDMSEPHAPFWVHGPGAIRLRVSSRRPLDARFAVGGGAAASAVVGSPRTITLPLRRGWNCVTIDVPHLLPARPKAVGLHLERLEVTSPSRGSRSRRRGSSR